MQFSTFDVAIIGGGPAGAAAAILLAQKGRKVAVFEKEKFPRFKIGESLLPYSLTAFDRLGIREYLDSAAMPKFGGEVATACGQRAVKFHFKDGFRLKHHQAYQVERATFDQALLNRARECGAQVFAETTVEQLSFADETVTLTVKDHAGGKRAVQARYLLDCSGRSSVVGRHFGMKVSYPHLQKFSCFAHYEGVQRDSGIDAGLTRLVRADDYWFWMIPLDERRTSVGVVMDLSVFKERKKSPEEVLAWAINDSALMRARMCDAKRLTEVHSVSDYSYRNRRLSGDRWLLAGDAAGFIDPIFSTGVFLAIHSGEQCADILDAVLNAPAKRGGLFRSYERSMHRIMDMYLRFVSAWYRPEFIAVFTTPTQRFQLAPAINAVLAGNIGNTFAIWWRMQLFYLVLFLQRYLPLCPRLENSRLQVAEAVEQAA